MRIDDGMQIGISFLGVLATLWTAIVTLLFLHVAWRAMRAHERVADALERQAAPKA